MAAAGTMTAETSSAAAPLTLNAFTRTGYSFSGWNTSANGSGTHYPDGAIYPFTTNATLYAQWVPDSFTVTFNANGGSGTMAPETSSVAAALTPNAFTRPAFAFSGWNTSPNGSGTPYSDGQSYPFTTNATLYAQWVPNSFTVTFNANGGTGTMAPETSSVAAPLTLNTFTQTGYDFSGWNTCRGRLGHALLGRRELRLCNKHDALRAMDRDLLDPAVNPAIHAAVNPAFHAAVHSPIDPALRSAFSADRHRYLTFLRPGLGRYPGLDQRNRVRHRLEIPRSRSERRSASAVSCPSTTSCTATSPGETAGTINVTVTTPGGASPTSVSDQFTYVPSPTITKISAGSGPARGGTKLTITGTNFLGTVSVRFGGKLATGVRVLSSSELTVTAPSGTGTLYVTVSALGGASKTTANSRYSYVPPPTITQVSPGARAHEGRHKGDNPRKQLRRTRVRTLRQQARNQRACSLVIRDHPCRSTRLRHRVCHGVGHGRIQQGNCHKRVPLLSAASSLTARAWSSSQSVERQPGHWPQKGRWWFPC